MDTELTEDQQDASHLNRRNFLEATGAAAGVGALTVGKANGEPLRDSTKVNFVDTGVTHDIEITDNYQPISIDELVDHAVSEDGDVYFSKFSSRDVIDAFLENDFVLHSDKYRTPPMDSITEKPNEWLVTELSGYRAMEGYLLAHEYQVPEISVEIQGNTVIASSGKTSNEIPPNEEAILDLPQQTVDILIEEATNEAVPEEEEKGESTDDNLQPAYSSESLVVDPEMVIRNYGELKILDQSDQKYVTAV